MALSTSAAYLGAASNSVNTDRKIVEILGGDQPGVGGSTEFVVSAAAGVHEVTVSAGRAFLEGKDVAGSQGYYFAWSDGDATVALPVPAGSAFIATVVLRVADSQYGALPGIEGAYFEVLSGTPSGSPVALSDAAIDATGVPGSWLRLADVRINTGDSGEIPGGQITDTRVVIDNMASIAARMTTAETDIGTNATAISDLAAVVAALDIPDIRITQTQPTTDLVVGKTLWVSWEA